MNRTIPILLLALLTCVLSACEITARRTSPGEGFRVTTPRTEESPPRPLATDRRDVDAVLDGLHRSAALADGERYFSLFAPDAIYFGTDPGERWTLDQFRDFAEPYFSQGRGWDYEALERNVFLDPSGDTAWFDERLVNEHYGECRGTGVLRKSEGRWRIVQYSLSIPVPNDLALELVERIREER